MKGQTSIRKKIKREQQNRKRERERERERWEKGIRKIIWADRDDSFIVTSKTGFVGFS